MTKVLLLALLINYNLISGLVTNYKIITWNSNGYKLDQVFNLFVSKNDLDFVFVQESGNVAAQRLGTKVVPKFYLADTQKQDPFYPDGLLEVRSIRHQTVLLYVYYFPSAPQVNNRISQTIVSRHYSPEVLYFVPQHSHNDILHDRAFTNRPIVGLVINNDIFLNIHAEPTQNRNEVLDQLDIIRQFMHNVRPNDSWLLVGDFNRSPTSLTLTAQERVVSPTLNTHKNKILDYLIFGSSNQNIFNSMNGSGYSGTVFDGVTGSDHQAVYFTK